MTPVTKAIDQGPSASSSIKYLSSKGKLNEMDDSMLEIAHLLDEIHTSNVVLDQMQSKKVTNFKNEKY